METKNDSRQDHENIIAEYSIKEKESIDILSDKPRDIKPVTESHPPVDTVSMEQDEFAQRVPDHDQTRSRSPCLADSKHSIQEGNLLNDVVTMHTTNCDDDDYSPTLAICDIFNKTKSSPCENYSECLVAKEVEEEVKDEFLIIDLDTCQTERGAKHENVCGKRSLTSHSKHQSKSPSKGLILVDLSEEDVQTNFLTPVGSNGICSESSSMCERKNNNFNQAKQDCDSTYDPCFSNVVEKCFLEDKEPKIEQKIIGEPSKELKINIPSTVGFKYDIGFQNKGLVINEMNVSLESSLSRETYPNEDNFYSSDMNDVSLRSNQVEESSPVIYMPEVYTKINDTKDKMNDRLCTFSNQPTFNTAISTDGNCDYYDYANASIFESLPMSSQFDTSGSQDMFDSQQSSRVVPHYSLEDKSRNFKMTSGKTSEYPPVYSLQASPPEGKQYGFKSLKVETPVPYRQPYYSTIQEHPAATQIFHGPYIPSYCASYPYSFQHLGEGNAAYLSNYPEWNSYGDSTIYEVNLNPYKTDYQQTKEHWSSDANMSDLYQDSHLGMKSNQTDIDSEATEDADETDGISMLLDNSADFSTCDNLSTMSVMSGSCFSDTSSVMAPFSPTEFTPPPSSSNTPIPSGHYNLNSFEDHKCVPSYMSDVSHSEPLHTYSPTMCSAPTYKIKTETGVPKLLTQTHTLGMPRPYASMADLHNSRSSMSISSTSTSSKFEEDLSSFGDCRKSLKSQIQSDKISTSTSRNAFDNRKWTPSSSHEVHDPIELFPEVIRHDVDCSIDTRRGRHNEPLKQHAIRIMSQWYEQHLANPYPTKEDKLKMAQEGGITVTQVKSWFANKRNRTNNTKPKVQKRAMKEKLKKLFQDLKHSRSDVMDNSHIIKQLSGIIQN